MASAGKKALPETIAYHIQGEIRSRIIHGHYAPGRALREQELEQEFGSSRGPIRESLRLLLQNGLVEHRPRRGFRVRDYTAADLRHIYKLRANLEALVIDDLEGRDLTKLTQNLTASNRRMEKHVAKNNRQGFFEENVAYHQLLIDAAENEPLARVMTYVNEISLPVRYRLIGESMPSGRSVKYHGRLINALKTGKIEKAQSIIREHILENLERAIAVFSQEQAA
ncbi:MAG: GntR family transcriptional regulator [Geminicoccales bacterium]